MINAASIMIVEDEMLIAETIRSILVRGGYSNILLAENVTEALTLLDVSEIELVITDIALGEERTGIDLGELLHTKYKIPFLYITSHASAEIVGKAKHTHPGAYIIKPFKKEDVLVAVELAMFKADAIPEEDGELIVKEGRTMVRIFHNDIKWIEADGNYASIYLLNNKRSVIRQSLSTLQEQLPESDFIRIHKSYLVNRKYINQVKAGAIYIGQREFPVGRSYQHIVVNLFR